MGRSEIDVIAAHLEAAREELTQAEILLSEANLVESALECL